MRSLFLIFFVVLFLNSLFAQYHIGLFYQNNHGDLHERNFSSKPKKGAGFFVEKPNKFTILKSSISFRLNFDYSSGQYHINHENLTPIESEVSDVIISFIFTTNINYRLRFIGVYGQGGFGIERYSREVYHPTDLRGIGLVGDLTDYSPFVNFGLGLKLFLIKNLSPYFELSQNKFKNNNVINMPGAHENNIRKKLTKMSIGLTYSF